MNFVNEKDRYKNSRLYIFIIFILGAVFYIWYCSSIMVEVPQQTWFNQLPLAELFYEQKLRFRDLFSRFGEHGMLANNILYLINLTLFRGCTMFDVMINDFNVIITAGLFIGISYKMLQNGRKEYFIAFLMAEACFLFSSTQGSSGGMETQVRLGILFFLIAMIFVDNELRNYTVLPRKHFYLTAIIIFLSINVFGTLYSFAGVPLVWFLIFYKRIRIFNSDSAAISKRTSAIAGIYLISIIIYVAEYQLYGVLSGNTEGGTGILHNLIYMVVHPVHTMKCLFSWYSNGAFGWAFHESQQYNQTVWLFMGAVIFLIILYAVFLFIRSKMYEKSWIPLMCIVYSFGVFVMVFLGREVEWEWFANEWYSVHIKLSLAGTVWIYGYAADKNMLQKLLCAINVFILFTFCCIGNHYTIQRAPAVHAYYKNMQKYLFISNKKDMPVDESGNTPLLQSLDMTMDSIELLQKYHLSVYKYWDAYENCPTTGLVGNYVKYISGVYEDGWAERVCSFQLKTNDADQIKVNYYAFADQQLTISSDGEVVETISLVAGESYFVIPCISDMEVTIEMKSNYETQLDAPDTRICSYLILDIERIVNN